MLEDEETVSTCPISVLSNYLQDRHEAFKSVQLPSRRSIIPFNPFDSILAFPAMTISAKMEEVRKLSVLPPKWMHYQLKKRAV